MEVAVALGSLAGAGVTEAWTANSDANAPVLSLNRSLGYRPAMNSCLVRRTR